MCIRDSYYLSKTTYSLQELGTKDCPQGFYAMGTILELIDH